MATSPGPSRIRAEPDAAPVADPYAIKYEALREKYAYVLESNNLIRNRLHHVKKEVIYLGRLKRVLCNRLLAVGDPYYLGVLEITDDDYIANQERANKKKAAAMVNQHEFPGPEPQNEFADWVMNQLDTEEIDPGSSPDIQLFENDPMMRNLMPGPSEPRKRRKKMSPEQICTKAKRDKKERKVDFALEALFDQLPSTSDAHSSNPGSP
ncbi:unnamed protein product, partial [Mesorhabditis spiculigera]